MSTHTVHRSRVVPAHSAPEFGRRTLTLIGAAALIVGACLNWTQNTLGTNLTFRSLLQEDFATRADVVRTSGGIAILLGIVALVGLVDRKAWLSRLAGLAAIAEFVMLAIEVYRGSGRTLQVGAWLLLAGGVVLLLGGSVHERNRYIETPAGGTAVDDGVDDTATRPATRRVPDREPVAAPESDAERTQVVNAPVDPSAEGRDF